METLTFPYGETPEDVIRDAWEPVNPINDIQRVSRECALYTESDTSQEHAADLNAALALLPYKTANELLTVLDALKVASKYGDDGSPYPDTKKAAARQLRISILAALGVTEK